MARKRSAIMVRNRYERQVRSAIGLFGAVKKYCSLEDPYDAMHVNPLHPGQAKKVVALAFLQVVAGWESFIEQTFVRYLAGAEFHGDPPLKLRIGVCENIDTAYKILFGSPDKSASDDYLAWTAHRTLQRAKLFFKSGHPYRNPIAAGRERLDDAMKIRNRVAHNSDKSKNDFKKIAQKFLDLGEDQPLRKGFTVGHLLLEPAARFFADYVHEKSWFEGEEVSFFEAYVRLFLDMADRIVPLEKPKVDASFAIEGADAIADLLEDEN